MTDNDCVRFHGKSKETTATLTVTSGHTFKEGMVVFTSDGNKLEIVDIKHTTIIVGKLSLWRKIVLVSREFIMKLKKIYLFVSKK